jgi:hypothetical protein
MARNTGHFLLAVSGFVWSAGGLLTVLLRD